MCDSSPQARQVTPDRKVGGGPVTMGRRFMAGFGVAVVLLGSALSTGCGHDTAPHQGAKVIEVIVTTPITHAVTDYQDFTGRLDSFRTVDIRPRVSGYINEAPFKEGDRVEKGALLFQIDPRTYQADLNQAEANLKQALADRNLQEKNAGRARRLFGTSAIGKEEYDQIQASWEKATATVGAAEAARDRAKLYLDYTRVIAPISGRISRRNVDPGNLVNADQTMLTTIVADNPMYAYFDVDERTYLELVKAPDGKRNKWFSGLEYPVLLRLANEEEFEQTGVVKFLDNRLVANTGTIRMRADVPNPAGLLKAGLFVRVRLPIGNPYPAILVPDEALMSDQGRKYVYIVSSKDEVEYRAVKLGQALQGLRVIKEGLAEGERVIVEGMQRVRPKSHVRVKLQAPPKPPHSPLEKLLTLDQTKDSPTHSDGEAVQPEAPARQHSPKR